LDITDINYHLLLDILYIYDSGVSHLTQARFYGASAMQYHIEDKLDSPSSHILLTQGQIVLSNRQQQEANAQPTTPPRWLHKNQQKKNM